MASVGRRRKSNHHLPPRVYIKFGAYYFVDPLTKKWIRLAPIGEEKEMRRQWAVLADPLDRSGNTTALIDDYLINYAKKHKAPRTYKDNVAEAEYLKAYFGDMKPQDILPRHVGKYLDLNSEQRPVRANREKALLSHVFTWAMRQDVWGTIITTNPCKGVHRNPETERVRVVDDSEFMGVYNLAGRNVQRLMNLVYRTLQRPSDILKTGPRNIITKEVEGVMRRVLRIKQSKTGATVEIFITPEIEKDLQPEGNVIYPNFIHTTRGNLQSGIGEAYTYSGIRSLFSKALEKYRNQVEQETGIRPPPFGIYDLKGKGATDMYRNGTPLEMIQVLCGHDSITTTEIYIKERMIDPVMPNARVVKA